MGLDTVELVMDIEEAFDISIPDDRASRMLTVGDVYEFILEKTADASLKGDACLTAATFYEFRRQLRNMGYPVVGIRPNSNVQNAIPLIHRRSIWKSLSTNMDLEFPKLQRPSWLSILNCMIVSVIVFGCFGAFIQVSVFLGLVVSALGCIVSVAFLLFLTRPFAIYPSPTCWTIRGLVTNLVALNFKKLTARYSTRNPKDIWNALQLIVAEQLGIDKKLVVPHARFVQDLGAD